AREWLDGLRALGGWAAASGLYAWPSGRQLVLPMVGKRIGGFTVLEDSFPHGWGYGGLVGPDVSASEAADVLADLAARNVWGQHIFPNFLQGDAWRPAVSPGAGSAHPSSSNAPPIHPPGPIYAPSPGVSAQP